MAQNDTGPAGFQPIEVPTRDHTALPGFRPLEVTPPRAPGAEPNTTKSRKAAKATTTSAAASTVEKES